MPDVIVGIDDSKPARAALEWAVRYAQREQLSLTVITVVDPLMGTAMWDAGLPDPQTTTAAARAEAMQMVAETLEHVGPPDVDVDVRAVTGHPVKALVDASEDADLLVVGSRGAGTFARLLLGSTSSGVAQHAHCSVMIVRDADATRPARRSE